MVDPMTLASACPPATREARTTQTLGGEPSKQKRDIMQMKYVSAERTAEGGVNLVIASADGAAAAYAFDKADLVSMATDLGSIATTPVPPAEDEAPAAKTD